MRACYYTNVMGFKELYVPGVMIATKTSNIIEVNFCPDELERRVLKWSSGNFVGAMKGIRVYFVDIPNSDLKDLIDFCFNRMVEDAEKQGRYIFRLAERELLGLK